MILPLSIAAYLTVSLLFSGLVIRRRGRPTVRRAVVGLLWPAGLAVVLWRELRP